MPSHPAALTCPAASEQNIPCQKSLYQASDGTIMDHAGGHMYATDETWALLNGNHYDAAALMSGQWASSHTPEECPGEPECWVSAVRDARPPTL